MTSSGGESGRGDWGSRCGRSAAQTGSPAAIATTSVATQQHPRRLSSRNAGCGDRRAVAATAHCCTLEMLWRSTRGVANRATCTGGLIIGALPAASGGCPSAFRGPRTMINAVHCRGRGAETPGGASRGVGVRGVGVGAVWYSTTTATGTRATLAVAGPGREQECDPRGGYDWEGRAARRTAHRRSPGAHRRHREVADHGNDHLGRGVAVQHRRRRDRRPGSNSAPTSATSRSAAFVLVQGPGG